MCVLLSPAGVGEALSVFQHFDFVGLRKPLSEKHTGLLLINRVVLLLARSANSLLCCGYRRRAARGFLLFFYLLVFQAFLFRDSFLIQLLFLTMLPMSGVR